MADGRVRGFHWRWVLLGAGLALVLNFLFGLIASAVGSIGLALALSALAFLAAGAITTAVGRDATPRDPALGAALVTAVVGGVQLAARPMPEVGTGRLVLSWLVSVVFAWLLTWLGGTLGRRRQRLAGPGPIGGPPAERPV